MDMRDRTFDFGAVRVVVAQVPELMALHGVPQPPLHHPEVDTLIHIGMVVDQAVLLTSEPAIQFAALLHDLGKGETPKDKLPHHPGHEQAGVPLVHQVCDRLGNVPDEWRDLAATVSAFHTRCHQAQALSARAMRRFFKEIDAHGNPQRFEAFLVACEADARGRTGFETRSYPQPALLREKLSQSPNPKDMEKGRRLMSESITKRLYEMSVEMRLSILDQFCSDCGQMQGGCTCQ